MSNIEQIPNILITIILCILFGAVLTTLFGGLIYTVVKIITKAIIDAKTELKERNDGIQKQSKKTKS